MDWVISRVSTENYIGISWIAPLSKAYIQSNASLFMNDHSLNYCLKTGVHDKFGLSHGISF